jgi:hypothetical protein
MFQMAGRFEKDRVQEYLKLFLLPFYHGKFFLVARLFLDAFLPTLTSFIRLGTAQGFLE